MLRVRGLLQQRGAMLGAGAAAAACSSSASAVASSHLRIACAASSACASPLLQAARHFRASAALLKSKPKTSRSVTSWVSANADGPAAADAPAKSKKKRVRPADQLPNWLWKKLPPKQKYAHLGAGVFHMVAASGGAGAAADLGLELTKGVSGRGLDLLRQEATIHRIIATEKDLIAEAARDSTLTSEVAIAGRSNVGKSSLLNAILKNGGFRKELATTSKTPGRTQQMFMFSFKNDRNCRVVDCPGYGYASTQLYKQVAWNLMMGLYLRKRHAQGILKRVLVLIDTRRGVGPLDEEFMRFLEGESIPYQLVLTKVDKVPAKKFKLQLNDIRAHLQSMPRGRFQDQAVREEYEARMKRMEEAGEDAEDAEELEEGSAEDTQWAQDADTGALSATSLSTGSSLPAWSCSIPVLHAVSSRHDLGLDSLKQAISKMLRLEPNVRNRAYVPEKASSAAGAAGEGQSLPGTDGAAAEEAAFDDDGLEDDGMGNVAEEDSFIPPVPVQNYDKPRPQRARPLCATQQQQPAERPHERAPKPKYAPRSPQSRSKFGSRPAPRGDGRRGFATSAAAQAETPRARKPSTRRASSAPPSSAPSADVDADATAAPAASAKAKATRAPRAKRASSASRTMASSGAASAVSTVAAAPSSDSTSSAASASLPPSASDAHLASIYQKKSQRQHILDRSETYIGSMHHQHSAQWVYDEQQAPGAAAVQRRMLQKECVFVPSLVHIFDEILVNAADNQHRVGSSGPAGLAADPDAAAAAQQMTTIRVDIDESSGRISIFNDGASIPIAMHPTERIPIPELIFGHLLTSSNYNDKEQRFTGGRHGYGAKLTNIFSTEFKVEIQDVSRQARYEQTFRNNMSERSEARIESFAALLAKKEPRKNLEANFTRITFLPDFARFHEKRLTSDTVAIMKKRVFDIAACVNTNIAVAKSASKSASKKAKASASASAAESESAPAVAAVKCIKVYLNGSLVDADSFPKYLDLFPAAMVDLEEDEPQQAGKWVFVNVNAAWQVAVGPNVAAYAPLVSSDAAAVTSDTPVTSLPPATRDISFVNSICTSRGGTHVQYVSDRLARIVADHILKTHGKTITRDMLPLALVKNHMSLLVNCKVPNPSFSSQTKESLMTPAKDFGPGSDLVFPQSFLTNLTSNATGIVPAIVDSITSRQQMELLKKSRLNASNKRGGRMLNIPKLDDAHWAGNADPAKVAQTTLILTEGDSAKALVLSSLSILGREKFGVFPLKGKLLNVRDASLKQVMDNAEIQNLLAIVGLEIGAQYGVGDGSNGSVKADPSKHAPSKPMRYGRIMLMTDQDHDGSHIKGLFINLLHTFWPELLKSSNFLEEFVTAIIKVRTGGGGVGKRGEILSFQTQAQFESWKAALPAEIQASPEKFKRAYSIKYYKGLGTNTSEEGKEYFRNIQNHRVKFVWGLGMPQQQPQRKQQKLLAPSAGPTLLPSASADAGSWIRLAFSKDQSDARKEWLQTCYDPSLFVDTTSKSLRLDDFINKELIVFSHADNIRSIPSVLDGLKPVQRKILFGCFKRGLTKGEIKVAQLSGYISEQTMYHHGEVSLQGSIINMAQSFIGSNNIALLVGSGQFGSRNTGGKDAAAARYIYTSLSSITRSLFHPHDDPLLSYRDEDGFSVEPDFFLPVIPMVLVNGAEGIGTGFSTFVPTFNPADILANLRATLRGERMQPMHPWTRGWTGEMHPVSVGEGTEPGEEVVTNYMTSGRVASLSPTTLEVTELPAGRWPDEFKTFLLSLQSDGHIKRFFDQCTDERIQFRIDLTPAQATEVERVGAMKFLKLTAGVSLNNMHLFSAFGMMRRYRSALEILEEFAVVRLEFYRRRREHLMIALAADLQRVRNKMKFIAGVTGGALKVYNRKKHDLLEELRGASYETAQQLLPRFPVYRDHTQAPPTHYLNHVAVPALSAPLDSDSYDYLLNMPLSTLTAEKLQALQADLDSTAAQLGAMRKADAKALWLQDLDKLEQIWRDSEVKRSKKASASGKLLQASELEDDE